MTTPKQQEPAMPVIKELSPQRPKTLLQRLSSGTLHAFPSLHPSSSKKYLIDRPATAPGPFGRRVKKTTVAANIDQLLSPNPAILVASDSSQPYPYDPDNYHLFAASAACEDQKLSHTSHAMHARQVALGRTAFPQVLTEDALLSRLVILPISPTAVTQCSWGLVLSPQSVLR